MNRFNHLKSVTAFLLVMIMLLSASCAGTKSDDETSPAVPSGTTTTDTRLLHTDGCEFKTADGKTVRLRGLNLGGWLIQEDWFCPTTSGVEDKQGDWYTMGTLEERFGTEKTYTLYDSYQDNWLTEADFKNIADMGYNCVRIPFWYRNFQTDDNGTWRLDENGNIDLSRLEWAVEMCGKYGIYAILDLHGAVGAQSVQDHSGKSDYYHFFDNSDEGEKCRRLTIELWEVVAERFKGNATVAIYDLLNEPMCNDYVGLLASEPKYVDFYNELYKAIRKIDPDHILMMTAVWDANKLPLPSKYNWQNVAYQFHWYDSTIKTYQNKIDKLFDRFNGENSELDKVPFIMGEFHQTKDKGLELNDIFAIFEENNLSWTAWTYKGLNSWANNADWWIYGSEQSCTVDPVNDSYEDILTKWGRNLRTDSGEFVEAKLYGITREFLGADAPETAPFNSIGN